MKKEIINLLVLVLVSFQTYSQSASINYFPKDLSNELYFKIHGMHNSTVEKEELKAAKLISDIVSNYPALWITNYDAIEITATCKGQIKKAISTNEKLTTEQKILLNNVDEATNVLVNIKYNYYDPSFKNLDKGNMRLSILVLPAKEAEFYGGQEQMNQFLSQNVISKIKATTPPKFRHGAVTFIVDENGNITNLKIVRTSEDEKTDKLLIELLSKMPSWKPAENAKGNKLKQKFEFQVGMKGC